MWYDLPMYVSGDKKYIVLRGKKVEGVMFNKLWANSHVGIDMFVHEFCWRNRMYVYLGVVVKKLCLFYIVKVVILYAGILILW